MTTTSLDDHDTAPLILLAAGGTGGHLFPAEALGVELIKRGMRVRLVTDFRALRYSGLFSSDMIDVVPSETVRGRDPWSLARTGAMLAAGTAVALNLMRRLKPAAVVGFGGYPTLAAAAGRAAVRHSHRHPRLQRGAGPRQPFSVGPRQRDRDLAAGRARSGSGAGGENDDDRHADASGDPCRRRGEICIARSDRSAAPAGGRRQPGRARDVGYRAGAIERLEPALWSRLILVQQVREEDMARVRAVYDRLKIDAELAPFFADLPARLASSHLVISRSGAGTVAELGAVGRPSILVPLPGSIDQDQFANAGVLAQAGGAIRIAQADFTPDRLAAEISALGRRAGTPDRDGRGRPHRRQARCRRAAGRSGGESSRNLGRIRPHFAPI